MYNLTHLFNFQIFYFISAVEKRHDVAITAMGNFLEHIQQKKSLREVDPSQVRIHTFGNPFKLKQQDQHDQVHAHVVDICFYYSSLET